MFRRAFSTLLCYLVMLWAPVALAQSSTTSVLVGTVTAKQVSEGLGFNLDPGQDWEWAAAAAAGASYARIQCAWANVEQQTAPPQNAAASTQYVEDPNCAAGFASAAKYGMHATVVAAYGPPSHPILTVSVPDGAALGATSFTIEMVSGFGGETLADMKFPYDYFCPAVNTTGCGTNVTGRGSYAGSLISSVTQIDSTHAKVTLASALTSALPAGGNTYLINEILYPSTATSDAADPSIEAYANYVSFLANDMAAHGVTGDVEIWNEPPWPHDPWDDRGYLYDPGLYGGTAEYGADFGFAANLMMRKFPAGVTATWNGTSATSNGSLLSTNMLLYSGTQLVEPSTTITRESFHPYSTTDGNPEDYVFEANCLQQQVNSSHPLGCGVPGTEGGSNLWQAVLYSLNQKAINPAYGLGHSITETNLLPPRAGLLVKQAQANLRRFLAFEADGITPVEFFKLCNGPAADPSYSFVNTSSCSSPSYTTTPALTALAGVVSDLKPIANAPVTAYTAADLPSVATYSGTYALATVNMVGARSGATANSDAFAVWQLSMCGTASCWYDLSSPAAAPVTVQVPSGMKVTSVTDLVTRAAISYTTSGQQISFKVSDNPIQVVLDPSSYAQSQTQLAVTANPTSSTYLQQVVLSAKLSPSTSGSATTDGESVQIYDDTSVLGTAKLQGGVASLSVTSFPAGLTHIYASYGGDANFSASSGSSSLQVSALTPTLTFPAIGDQAIGEGLFTVQATSNSPAPISYKVVSGGAWISSQSTAGALMKPTLLGTVVFQATQPATGSYAASSATTSFTVVGENPSLTFNAIATKLYGSSGPFAALASSRSQGAITYTVLSGPAKVSGSMVTLTGAGTVTLGASQVASGLYAAATTQISFGVSAQNNTGLTMPAVGTQTIGEGLFTIQASSQSPATIKYKVVSGGAWISSQGTGGAILKPTELGPVVFEADQAAVGNYAAASTQVTFTVN